MESILCWKEGTWKVQCIGTLQLFFSMPTLSFFSLQYIHCKPLILNTQNSYFLNTSTTEMRLFISVRKIQRKSGFTVIGAMCNFFFFLLFFSKNSTLNFSSSSFSFVLTIFFQPSFSQKMLAVYFLLQKVSESMF